MAHFILFLPHGFRPRAGDTMTREYYEAWRKEDRPYAVISEARVK